MIMTHGWPGSVIELLEIVGPLTDPPVHGGRPEDAFELVLQPLVISLERPDEGVAVRKRCAEPNRQRRPVLHRRLDDLFVAPQGLRLSSPAQAGTSAVGSTIAYR